MTPPQDPLRTRAEVLSLIAELRTARAASPERREDGPLYVVSRRDVDTLQEALFEIGSAISPANRGASLLARWLREHGIALAAPSVESPASSAESSAAALRAAPAEPQPAVDVEIRDDLDSDAFRDDHERAIRAHILEGPEDHRCDDLCSAAIIDRLVGKHPINEYPKGSDLLSSLAALPTATEPADSTNPNAVDSGLVAGTADGLLEASGGEPERYLAMAAEMEAADRPPTLDEAWKAAEAALPEGADLAVSKTVGVQSGTHVAVSADAGVHAYADTPAAALLALAAALSKPASPAIAARDGGET